MSRRSRLRDQSRQPIYADPSAPGAGYARVPNPGDPRLSEAWALLEAARRLDEAMKAPEGTALRDAILLNWRLWTMFEATAGTPAGGLPDEVRTNIMTLCRFVARESEELLAVLDPFLVQPLIDVNRAVADGLYKASDNSYPRAAPKPLRMRMTI